MNPQKDNIGYSHDHLGAIQMGMPVFDTNNDEIGAVTDIEFASNEDSANGGKLEGIASHMRDQLLKSGYIKIQNEQGEAWYAAGNQINYVNEGVVQLNVPETALVKI
jgi:sporulation protein YlmC with PRC-barrel domain